MFIVWLIRHLILSKRYISHHNIKKILRMVCFFKTRNLNLCLWIKLLCDPSGQAVQLHPVQAAVLHPLRQHPEEIPDTYRRFQNISFFKPHPAKCIVDRTDNYRRCVMGI